MYLFQLGSPCLSWGLSPQLAGGGTEMYPQQVLISVQSGPEGNQNYPEDPGNSPYCHQESSLETTARCSKEPSAPPVAISFCGALMIPVRSWGHGGGREAL